MKKSLLISAGVLTLLGVSATLFAQTATGGSLITEMKASIRSFTLASDLNPGTTGLQSYPVTGKETGDMLTAGEWNRVLELVAQGGGGGGRFEINDSTTKTTYRLTYYPADLWSTSSPTPTTIACTDGQTECKIIDTAAHDLCLVTSIAGTAPHVSLTYQGNKRYRLYNSYRDSASLAPYSSGITVQCYDNIGGGGTGGGTGGAGWVDISLTGTDEFNESCAYRMQAGSTGWNYAWQVYRTSLWFKVSTNSDDRIASVPSNEKGYWDYYTNGNTTNILQNNVMPVQKIQQMCGGGGSGSSCYKKTQTSLTPKSAVPNASIDYSCNNANDYIASVACTSNQGLTENIVGLGSVSCLTAGGGNLSGHTNTKVEMVCCSL